MIKIHNKVLNTDIPRAEKKRWYPGIGIELKKVLKLLDIDKKLPGQFPMRGFKHGLEGQVLHARIALPKANCGKSNGPRIVYIVGNPEIKILYVGGHKDKKYNDDNAIVNEVGLRLADDDFEQ